MSQVTLQQGDVVAPDLVLRDFAAQCVVRGLILGFCSIFLIDASKIYYKKRSWIAMANIVQLLFFIGFILVQIVFLCLPASVLNCNYRNHLAAILVDAQVVCVWLINWIKLSAMFPKNYWVKYGTAALSVASVAGQFQYLFTKVLPDPDVLGRCRQKGDPISEAIHQGTDLFVRLVLSGLFVYAIYSHVSKIKHSSNKLFSIITSDIRATFIDTIALLVKFAITLANLPSSQTRFVFHVMDFSKAAGTHWFVTEISKKSSSASSSASTKSKMSDSGANTIKSQAM